METVIRRYQGEQSQFDELSRLVRDQGKDVITTIPGFVFYTLGTDGQGTLVSVGTFDDKAGADESTRRAASFIRQRAPNLRLPTPSVLDGRTLIRRFAAGVLPGYGMLRIYHINPTDLDEIVRRAENGLVQLIAEGKGFSAYNFVDAGNGTVVSITAFQTRQEAESSAQAVQQWGQTNLGSLIPNPPEVLGGEVRVAWRK